MLPNDGSTYKFSTLPWYESDTFRRNSISNFEFWCFYFSYCIFPLQKFHLVFVVVVYNSFLLIYSFSDETLPSYLLSFKHVFFISKNIFVKATLNYLLNSTYDSLHRKFTLPNPPPTPYTVQAFLLISMSHSFWC